MAEEEVKSLKYNSESFGRQLFTAIYQNEFQDALEPPPWLDHMESPFKWAQDLNFALTYYLMHRKLLDYKNQGAFYGFEKFAILLVIVLRRIIQCSKDESEVDEPEEESKIREEDDGDKNEDVVGDEYYYELEEALAKCEETIEEMAANEGDVMFSRIGPVFYHVLQTIKSHILFLQGKIAESKELAKNIQGVEGMSVECKAGVEGLRVKLIMSMYEDYTILLPILSKAIELDPKFGYWHYLTGKVLRRIRRDLKKEMDIEELKHFEKAVELERNPKFLVFLAQAYQEMAALAPRGTNDNTLRQSVDLYRECWRLKNDSASISRRVGNGMMKMRGGLVDKVVAKEALLKSEELSPHGPSLALGKFYYYHEKNDEKALECFKKHAPTSFAIGEIIRLNLIKDPHYDPLDELEAWLKAIQGTLKQQSAWCDCGWYYLMYKKDLETSAKYFWKVLKMDYESFKVLEYNSYGFLVQGPINMVKVLVNEILLLKEKNETLPPEERNNLEFLENFLVKVLEKHPQLQNITPEPYLLEELKMEVEQKIAFRRRQRYKGNFRRSEPSSTVEESGSWRNNSPSDGAQVNNNQEPYMRQEVDDNRRYNNWQSSTNSGNNSDDNRRCNNWQSSTNRGNNSRSDIRNRFPVVDDDVRNRSYNRDDRRRNSESQSSSNWKNGRTSEVKEGICNQSETNDRFSYSNRGRTDRQYNSYNSRYDVTVTNWRSENRK